MGLHVYLIFGTCNSILIYCSNFAGPVYVYNVAAPGGPTLAEITIFQFDFKLYLRINCVRNSKAR